MEISFVSVSTKPIMANQKRFNRISDYLEL